MTVARISEGGRWELMVDDALLAHLEGASLTMHSPDRQEVVLQSEHSWEGDAIGTAMIQVDGEIRMYYRGYCREKEHRQAICVAISTDGIDLSCFALLSKRGEIGEVDLARPGSERDDASASDDRHGKPINSETLPSVR